MDTDLDCWQRDVAGFVAARLPPPPARVLEVGCGSGWLTRTLAGAGHDVRGIDPNAPDDPLLLPVSLEDFEAPGAFDAAVASLSLHHIRDLGAAVGKLADLLGAGGVLVVVEYAWDRFDDATARWCLDRLPERPGEDNWLAERLLPLRDRRGSGAPLRARELIGEWAAQEGLHSSAEVREVLRRRFDERLLDWGPYLYSDLPGVTGAEERAAIIGGEIQPIGLRVVASARE